MQESTTPVTEPSASQRASLADDELELPLLGWFFVVVAAIDLLGQIVLVNPALNGWVYLVVQGLTSVGTALLPAALLYGVPDAARSHRLLLVALGALALLQLAVTGLLVFIRILGLSTDDIDTINTISLVIQALIAAAYLLYGLGLARVRGSTPTPNTRWILLVLVLAEAIPAAISTLPGPSNGTAQDALELWFFVVSVVSAAATGFVAWVAVAAWLDHVEPRRFWMVLAVAALAGGIALIVSDLVSQASTSGQFDADLAGDVVTIGGVVSLAAIAAAIYAFAQLLPEGGPSRATPVDTAAQTEPVEPPATITPTPTA